MYGNTVWNKKKFQQILTFFLLSDDADSAEQPSKTNNSANLDICVKSVYGLSFGTQRKGLMKKIGTKSSHATVPLSSK
jgi:hypothetical protein